MLNNEYNFYKKNKKSLDKKYTGRYIVVVGNKIVGIYEDEATAYSESIKNYKEGSFLIQKCGSDEGVVQTFHSRVVFT